jgi:dTDP-4-amino-4,6-dideoxygalactose transaminase
MEIKIPIAKPLVTQDEIDYVMDVLKSGQLAQGKKVEELESQFNKLTGYHAVASTNGTTALHVALHGVGVKEGDEVITVPFTFVATANSIRMCGATPVFVDINEKDYTIDVNKIEKAITKKTKAIMPVNLFGQCADYKKINEIAKKHNLLVIEDSAQSIGATQDGKQSGALADASGYSLYATKNIMSGEGGVTTFKNDAHAKIAKQFRHHGQGERYEYVAFGYNYRMTDLIAAIAVAQMRNLDKITKSRQHNAKLYDSLLNGIKGLIIPHVSMGNTHVYHQYAIRVTKDFNMSRDELKKKLEDNGIGTGIHYPKPLHLHEAFRFMGHKEGDFPISEKVAKEILSIPVHPSVTEDNIRFISKIIKEN